MLDTHLIPVVRISGFSTALSPSGVGTNDVNTDATLEGLDGQWGVLSPTIVSVPDMLVTTSLLETSMPSAT